MVDGGVKPAANIHHQPFFLSPSAIHHPPCTIHHLLLVIVPPSGYQSAHDKA
jgi:hypothetical protein